MPIQPPPKPQNEMKSDLEKRFVEMIMREQKKQIMLQKREERRIKNESKVQ